MRTLLILSFICLYWFDAFITAFGIDSGLTREGNPLLAGAIQNYGLWTIFVGKAIGMSVILIGLFWLSTFRLTKLINYLTGSLTLIYLLTAIWNISILIPVLAS